MEAPDFAVVTTRGPMPIDPRMKRIGMARGGGRTRAQSSVAPSGNERIKVIERSPPVALHAASAGDESNDASWFATDSDLHS